MSYLGKWFLGDLFLPFLFSSKDHKDATEQVYLHPREGRGNRHQKNRSMLFDPIFPSTLLLPKGS